MTYMKIFGLCGAALLLWASSAMAAVLQIPEVSGRAGETVEVPVIVEGVRNLAGVKLVLHYDASVLQFRSAAKTGQTATMMHVVNDKEPGRLTVVMAAAKGIGGRRLRLLTLTFAIRKLPDAGGRKPMEWDISDLELMSDRLEAIDCTPVCRPLRVQKR